MNKRSFIKSMLMAAVAPAAFAGVASDRFKWKKSGELFVPNEFDAREYAGEWKFTYQSQDGMWVSEQRHSQIVPVSTASPIYKSETHIRVFREDRDKSYIFHRRESLIDSLCEALSAA